MKAFVIDQYQDRLHAADVAEPQLGEHDVLIEVAAAGLNQLDAKISHGDFKQILPYKFPLVLGHDVAGTVVATGSRVGRFKTGDQVYSRPGTHQIGTFAERVAVAESDVAVRPESVNVVEAASLPLVALTAWQALVDRGSVQPGQRVLVHGGAGGVGRVAIQLAKHLQASVATTVSGADADLVRQLGADVVIDYRTQDFADHIHGYEFVLDSVGGQTLQKSLGVLAPGGKVVGIAGPPDPAFARRLGLNPVLRVALAVLSHKIRRAAKKLGVTYEFLFMRADGAQLEQITALVDQGVIKAHVDATFPFEQTDQAYQAMVGGGRGKVVVERA